jgi:glyoxylase-like metal-dependent hydrolase (beta-lactamase superfamily II)
MVERVVVGPWKTNCYIYSSAKKECIIIDPGGSEAEIATRVDVLNMVPVGIALTHGHVDHLAALGTLRDSYARRGYKLPIAIQSLDRKYLGTGGLETHRESLEHIGLDQGSFFGADPAELPRADVRLREGDRVFDQDIVVLETPGHTPGSVCFYAEKEGIIFSGDTIFADGVGRTDLAGGSEKKLRESITKKIATLPPETRIFPGHGPFTTVEREKRGNAFFRSPPKPIVAAPLIRDADTPVAVKAPAGSVPLTTRRGVALKPARAPSRKAARKRLRAPARKTPVRPAKPARASTKGKAARPGKPARPAKKKDLRPAVSRPSKHPSKSKGKARRKPAAPPRREVLRGQATKSRKVPGSGRKPAR